MEIIKFYELPYKLLNLKTHFNDHLHSGEKPIHFMLYTNSNLLTKYSIALAFCRLALYLVIVKTSANRKSLYLRVCRLVGWFVASYITIRCLDGVACTVEHRTE